MAACGGALVYGALPRIVRHHCWQAGVFLGLGLAILMYSRPYEGLVAGIPAIVVLAVWLVRSGPRAALRQLVRVGPAVAVPLGLAACWLGCYHAAVTGDPLRFPYQVHDATYASCPAFFWQSPGPTPQYRHAEMADYWVGWVLPGFLRKRFCWGLNGSAVTKLWVFFRFYVGAAFVLPLVALWRNCRDRWMWLAAAVCGLLLLAMLERPICIPTTWPRSRR